MLIWLEIWCLLNRPIHYTMTLVVILRFPALNIAYFCPSKSHKHFKLYRLFMAFIY